MKLVRTWSVAAVLAAVAVLGYGVLQGIAPSSAKAAGEALPTSPARVDNFRLADANLQSHELYRLADAKAVVIVTQANGCPVARNISADLKALQDAYAAKGVEFLLLNSSTVDSRDEIAAEAKTYGFTAPVLMDVNQLVGEQLGVTRTAEAFVIDPKTWKIVYRGPINDRVTYERQKDHATANWAKDALDALLGGQQVAVAQQPAVGCIVDFPARVALAHNPNISYARDIAPIIETKCTSCHQQGGIGPMQLTSYDRVKAYSPMIREVLRTQRMPPFHADPGVGHFQDSKALSPAQIKTLVHWIDSGSPRGAGDDPLTKVAYHHEEWPLGKPDLILDVPCHDVPATGVVDYQRPWVKNPLTEGKWLRASTIEVGDRQAVHHILTGYMNTPPEAGHPANENRWGASVGGYAVGSESTVMPTHLGTYLPPGGAIGFQVHYTPYGKAITDCSKIALYFYDKPPELMMRNSVIANPNISIPPNEERHQESAYVTFPKDALLYSAFPHAHYRGASSKLTLRYPDGHEQLLLALPKYDFNWQRDYTFAQPIKIPAGSKLIAVYTYDNSRRNPANPNPDRTVPWGDQSFDEMLYTALRYRWLDETAVKQTDNDRGLNSTRFMGMLDTNMDGKLSPAELKGPMGGMLAMAFKQIDTNNDGFIDASELAAAQAKMGGGRRASR